MIARELTTKLSFAFDRSNLDRFEKSIKSFKSGIVTTYGEVAALVGKVVNYFHEVSTSAIRIKDIADYTGIAVEDFAAMRQGAASLGLSTSIFDQAIKKLSIDIRQAKNGMGDLIQVVSQSQGKVRIPFLDDAENLKEVLGDIFDYLETLPKQSDKLAFVSKYFGLDLHESAEFVRIANQGREAFEKARESQREYGKNIADSTAAAIQYSRELNKLATETDKLIGKINSIIVPYIGNALKLVNDAIDEAPTQAKKGGGGVSGFFKQVLNDPFPKKKFGLDIANKIGGNVNVTNNNRFEFNVPPGTTEAQASWITQEVQSAIAKSKDQEIRELINNNPQVE